MGRYQRRFFPVVPLTPALWIKDQMLKSIYVKPLKSLKWLESINQIKQISFSLLILNETLQQFWRYPPEKSIQDQGILSLGSTLLCQFSIIDQILEKATVAHRTELYLLTRPLLSFSEEVFERLKRSKKNCLAK